MESIWGMSGKRLPDNVLDQSIFTISLDMELAWGFILYPEDKYLALLQNDPQQGRGAVDLLLKLFEKYKVSATWAIGGHLFLGPGEGKELVHRELPQFTEGWLDWDFYDSLKDNPLYYGKDIVERILTSPVKHEIGLHGFFHIPFSRCSRKVAEVEMEREVEAAKKFGLAPKSFVFPEEKIGHLPMLKEKGVQIYRGQTSSRWKENQSFLVRKFNGAIGKLVAPPVSPLYRDGLWEIPSSMYFYDSQMPLSLLPRARLGLSRAIQANRVFHIWLHPWNLLLYSRLAKDLEGFLALVARNREKEKLQVMTMGGLASHLNRKSAEPNK
jgi:peptidoglycan/xylan/chitin deacetylase (PgdA/CDA1 family)